MEQVPWKPLTIYDAPGTAVRRLVEGEGDQLWDLLTDPDKLPPHARIDYGDSLIAKYGGNPLADAAIGVATNPFTWLLFLTTPVGAQALKSGASIFNNAYRTQYSVFVEKHHGILKQLGLTTALQFGSGTWLNAVGQHVASTYRRYVGTSTSRYAQTVGKKEIELIQRVQARHPELKISDLDPNSYRKGSAERQVVEEIRAALNVKTHRLDEDVVEGVRQYDYDVKKEVWDKNQMQWVEKEAFFGETPPERRLSNAVALREARRKQARQLVQDDQALPKKKRQLPEGYGAAMAEAERIVGERYSLVNPRIQEPVDAASLGGLSHRELLRLSEEGKIRYQPKAVRESTAKAADRVWQEYGLEDYYQGVAAEREHILLKVLGDEEHYAQTLEAKRFANKGRRLSGEAEVPEFGELKLDKTKLKNLLAGLKDNVTDGISEGVTEGEAVISELLGPRIAGRYAAGDLDYKTLSGLLEDAMLPHISRRADGSYAYFANLNLARPVRPSYGGIHNPGRFGGQRQEDFLTPSSSLYPRTHQEAKWDPDALDEMEEVLEAVGERDLVVRRLSQKEREPLPDGVEERPRQADLIRKEADRVATADGDRFLVGFVPDFMESTKRNYHDMVRTYSLYSGPISEGILWAEWQTMRALREMPDQTTTALGTKRMRSSLPGGGLPYSKSVAEANAAVSVELKAISSRMDELDDYSGLSETERWAKMVRDPRFRDPYDRLKKASTEINLVPKGEGGQLATDPLRAVSPASLIRKAHDLMPNSWNQAHLAKVWLPAVLGRAHPNVIGAVDADLLGKRVMGALVESRLGQYVRKQGKWGEELVGEMERIADPNVPYLIKGGGLQGAMSRALYVTHLGINVASMALNMTQPLLLAATVVPMRHLLPAYADAMKDMWSYAKARAKYPKVLLTDEEKSRLVKQHFRASNWMDSHGNTHDLLGIGDHYMDVVDQVTAQGVSRSRSKFDRFGEVLMKGFEKTEWLNRNVTFHAYRRMRNAAPPLKMPSGAMRKLSEQDDSFIMDAQRFVQETQFGADDLNIPSLFQTNPILSNPLMRMFLQFPLRSFTGVLEMSKMDPGGRAAGMLNVLGRGIGISAITYEVAKGLAGVDLSRGLFVSAATDLFGGDRLISGGENDWIPVPPVIDIPLDMVRGLAGDDANLVMNSVARTIPGGVAIVRAMGVLPEMPRSPLAGLPGAMQKEYIDYANPTPDGLYPVFKGDGSLVGFRSAGEIFLRGLGGDFNRWNQQGSLDNYLVRQRDEIVSRRHRLLRALAGNDVRRAEQIRSEFAEEFGFPLTVTQAQLDAYVRNRSRSRTERVLDRVDPAARPQLGRMVAASGYAGNVEGRALVEQATGSARDPYRNWTFAQEEQLRQAYAASGAAPPDAQTPPGVPR